jgi:hypothetical protein
MDQQLVNIPAVSAGLKVQYQNEVNKLTNFSDTVEALSFATHLIKSNVLPKGYDKPETVLIAMQMGKELGLNAVSAIFGIDIIQGRPALSSKLMAALVWANGCAMTTVKDGEIILDSEGRFKDMITTIEFRRPYTVGNTTEVIREKVSFTWSEATALGLSSKDQWKKQPGVMLYWRALSKGVRRIIPDKIAGLYNTLEMADTAGMSYMVNDDGEIIQ